jgi:hypothetical protein
MKTKVFKDQWSACAFLYYSDDYGLINYSMGLGKTLISLAYSQYLFHIKKIAKRILILCPNTVKYGWEKEIHKHTHDDVKIVGNGTEVVLRDLEKFKASNTKYLVVHYDAIRIKVKNSKTEKSIESRIFDKLIEIAPEMIIIDESHIVRYMEALVTQATIKLCLSKNIQSVIFMTGTVMEKTPLDIYVPQLICMPETITTKNRFEDFYTLKKERKFGKYKTIHEVYGYKNLGYFREMTSLFSIRRTKKDVPGMIPEAEIRKEIEMTSYQKQLVKQIKDIGKQIQENKIQYGNIKELNVEKIKQTFVRLRQISNNPALIGGKNESAKYDLLEETLEEILSDEHERILIFTDFYDAINLIADRLQKWNPIKIDGTETENKQQLIEKLENRSLNHRVLISTPYRIGIGCSFSRTSYMVYVDKPVSSMLLKQSKDRIVRRDSEGNVATFIYLYSLYNGVKFVDHKIDKMLERKEKTHDAFIESAELVLDKWDIDDIQDLLKGIFNEL